MVSSGVVGAIKSQYGLIGYAAVSSEEQHDTNALDQQIERLKSLGCEAIYWDVASRYKISSKLPNREQVINLVRDRRCAEVAITRVDRISRRGFRTLQIYELFESTGVALRVLDEPIDLSTAAGKMVAGMVAVSAQHHSDQKSEAVRHGWAHLRAKGVAMNPPFGYVKVGDRFELDTAPFITMLNGETLSKSQIARMLLDAYFKSGSLRGGCRWLNETFGIQTTANNNAAGEPMGGLTTRKVMRFSPSGLRDWLTSYVLLGHTAYLVGRRHKDRQPIIHYDTHAPLITQAERDEIDRLLAHNKRHRGFGATRLKYPLSGLVYCAECNAAHYSLTGQRNYQKAKRLGVPPEINYYYQCKNWRVRGCGQKKVIRMEVVESAVIEALQSRANEIATIAAAPPKAIDSPKLIALKKELTALEMSPNPARVATAIAEVKSQIEIMQRSEKAEAGMQIQGQEWLASAFSDADYWRQLDTEGKQKVYRLLVRKVSVREGEVVAITLKV